MVTTAGPRHRKRLAQPIEASPGRRLFHLFIAFSGWVLFVYWWLLVLGQVGREQVRTTAIFIGVTALVVVAATLIWALHNQLIFRRKGPRTRLKAVKEDFSRDRLGRAVAFAGSIEALQNEPIVLIRLEHGGKTYRASGNISRGDPLPLPTRFQVSIEPGPARQPAARRRSGP